MNKNKKYALVLKLKKFIEPSLIFEEIAIPLRTELEGLGVVIGIMPEYWSRQPYDSNFILINLNGKEYYFKYLIIKINLDHLQSGLKTIRQFLIDRKLIEHSFLFFDREFNLLGGGLSILNPNINLENTKFWLVIKIRKFIQPDLIYKELANPLNAMLEEQGVLTSAMPEYWSRQPKYGSDFIPITIKGKECYFKFLKVSISVTNLRNGLKTIKKFLKERNLLECSSVFFAKEFNLLNDGLTFKH